MTPMDKTAKTNATPTDAARGAPGPRDDPRPGRPREAALVAAVTERGATPATLRAFRAQILDHFAANGRDLPWRRTADPYAILVSEVMLQQTQVLRVCGRWERFVERFPDLETLADAPLADVLAEWQGLGYNRRAAFLQRTAGLVLSRHGGELPSDVALLRTLPGLGEATAASVSAFAFGTPVAFIETNIRAVYLHVFFAERDGVPDAEILPLALMALDREDPRRWHWALMDYGAALKSSLPNPSRRGAGHSIQSRFDGSNRQLRGLVLRALLANEMTLDELAEQTGNDARLCDALAALQRDGLVSEEAGAFSIP